GRHRADLLPVAGVPGFVPHRFGVDHHAAAFAALARLAERLQQPRAYPLPCHLHQTERGDLGDLVLGAVPGQALDQPAQHQLPVGLQHHVDEVDDDDAADVPQPQLPDDLLGRLQVVTGDRLFQVAAGAGVLTGVDVDDGHRLGAVEHQVPARRQVDLTVQPFEDLLVDPVMAEHIGGAGVPAQPRHQIRGDVRQVRLDRLVRLVPLD